MQETELVEAFFKAIPAYYSIPNPLVKSYVAFNYTDRLDLPTGSELVTHVNFTLPIMTPKELTIAAQALRDHSFFHSF